MNWLSDVFQKGGPFFIVNTFFLAIVIGLIVERAIYFLGRGHLNAKTAAGNPGPHHHVARALLGRKRQQPHQNDQSDDEGRADDARPDNARHVPPRIERVNERACRRQQEDEGDEFEHGFM